MDKSQYKTRQEEFWAGDFGDSYINRNCGSNLLASNIAFFSRALRAAQSPASIIEFGANIGMNLSALQLLYPKARTEAVEINSEAAKALKMRCQNTVVHNESMFDFTAEEQYDLVLVKGVLIHLSPSMLSLAYEKMFQCCKKYVLLCEYYSRNPVEIEYRGHRDRLFKRDFAGELLDSYPGLRLLDYGFSYHRDPSFPQDDINWFLIRK